MAREKATDRIAKQKDKTRTHIFYEVERNGAIEMKEIPFDMGVMGDFAGDRKDRRKLDERDFAEVNSENFDAVMAENIKPRLDLELEFGENLQNVSLEFKRLKDFGPEEILRQLSTKVDSVKELKKIRDSLFQLVQLGNVNPDFLGMLQEALADPSKLKALAEQFEKSGA